MWWRLTLPCLPELEESLVWKLTDLGLHRHAVQHAPETPDRKTLLVWLPKPEWPEPQRRELVASLQPLAEPFGLSLPDGHWLCMHSHHHSLHFSVENLDLCSCRLAN